MKETINSRVAVLETQVTSMDKKLDELRVDIKDMHDCLDKTRDLIVSEIQLLKQEEHLAHNQLNTRLTTLEQWRWYVLGVAAAVGYIVSHLDLVKSLIT
jgi:adenylosuccinate lyase